MPEMMRRGIWLVSALGPGLPTRTHTLWTTCIVILPIQVVEWIYTWWIPVCLFIRFLLNCISTSASEGVFVEHVRELRSNGFQ